MQQSITEFVLRHGSHAFVPPSEMTRDWPLELRQNVTRVELLDAAPLGIEMGGDAPLLLKDSQWILQKAYHARPLSTRYETEHGTTTQNSSDSERGASVHGVPVEARGSASLAPLRKPMRCCLNGWAGYLNRSITGPLRECAPPGAFFNQQGYHLNCPSSGAARDPYCRFRYTCTRTAALGSTTSTSRSDTPSRSTIRIPTGLSTAAANALRQRLHG